MLWAVHEFADHLRVQGMSGFVRYDMSDDWHTYEREVADEVEDLMPHEFVLVPQTFLVQHCVLTKDHGVVHGAAFGKAVGLKGLYIAQEPERAGVDYFAQECLFRWLVLEALFL